MGKITAQAELNPILKKLENKYDDYSIKIYNLECRPDVFVVFVSSSKSKKYYVLIVYDKETFTINSEIQIFPRNLFIAFNHVINDGDIVLTRPKCLSSEDVDILRKTIEECVDTDK